MRYDDGPLAVLHEVADFELYLSQNSSEDIKRRREVRMALRALDGKVVNWPYDHIQVRTVLSCSGSNIYEHSARWCQVPLVLWPPLSSANNSSLPYWSVPSETSREPRLGTTQPR